LIELLASWHEFHEYVMSLLTCESCQSNNDPKM